VVRYFFFVASEITTETVSDSLQMIRDKKCERGHKNCYTECRVMYVQCRTYGGTRDGDKNWTYISNTNVCTFTM